MQCWQILGLEPHFSVKDVKRAYAVQLKQYRPDEYPEQFQTIHAAYKSTLKMAKRQVQELSQVSEELQVNTEVISSNFQAEPKLESHIVVTAPEELVEQPFSLDVSDIKVKTTRSHHIYQQPQINDQEPLKVRVEPVGGQQEYVEDNALTSFTAHSVVNSFQIESSEPNVEDKLDYQKDKVTEFDNLISQLQALFNEDKQKKQITNWYFFADSAYILEDDFNHDLGKEIFALIANHNRIFKVNKKRPNNAKISRSIIAYLNEIFNWNGARQFFYGHYDALVADEIFGPLDKDLSRLNQEKIYKSRGATITKVVEFSDSEIEKFYTAGFLLRLLAFVVDLGVLLIIIGIGLSLWIMFNESSVSRLEYWGRLGTISMSFYYVLSTVLEASKWNTTLGKYLTGCMVTDVNYKPIGFWRSLGRCFYFTFSIIFIKFTAIPSIILVIRGEGIMLHDRFSYSRVVNIRKSRKEHLRKQMEAG